MSRGVVKTWTDEYERNCFDVWYLGGRTTHPIQIREMIPENPNGKKPSIPIIKNWLHGSWFFRADELDAKVQLLADENLINEKVVLLKKHQKQAAQVEAKALEYLITEGFDSSASAVQALFRGMEEERKTLGFSDLLEKLDNMTNNQVRDTIINLINRATENNQIVEGSDAVAQIEDGEEIITEDDA